MTDEWKNNENQKYTMKIELEVKYDDQFLEDVIVIALEGGSNYWIECIKVKDFENSNPKNVPLSEWIFNQLKNDKIIVIYLEHDQRAYLTMRKLKYGIKKYFSDSSKLIGGLTLDAGDYDADMADCVLQYAVFDELVYG